jgi:predicted nucleic acid-binding protein
MGEHRPLFLDTWGWLVLADRKDPEHRRTVEVRREFSERGRLVTTDYVLDETFTRLFTRSPFAAAEAFLCAVLAAADEGLLQIEFIDSERFREACQLRGRYRDKPRISLTDLTSFVVMKQLGIRDVLTADEHFEHAGLGFRILPS